MRLALAAALVVSCFGQTIGQPSRALTDPGVVTTRQAITPAGVPSIFQGRVYGVAWAGTSGDLWVLHASEIYRLDWKNNRVVAQIPHGGAPGNQSILYDPVTSDLLIGTSVRESRSTTPKARLVALKETALRTVAPSLGSWQPGAISVAAETDEAGRRYSVVTTRIRKQTHRHRCQSWRSDAADPDRHRTFCRNH